MDEWGVRYRARRVLLAVLVVPVVTAGLVAGIDLAPVRSAPVAEAATVLGRVTNGGGRCLENLNNATTVNNTIRINACSTAPAQQWSRWADETLKTPAGRCIEPYGRSKRDGTVVVLVACAAGATSQKWVPYAGVLINRGTNKCLQYAGANVNGSRASIATCNTKVPAQRWAVPAVSTPAPPPTATTTVRPPPPPVTTTTVAPPPTTSTIPLPPGTTTTTAAPPPPGSTTTVPLPPGSTTTAPPTTTGTPRPFVPVGSTVWRADMTKTDVVKAGFRNNSYNRQLADGVYNNPALPWPVPIGAGPEGRRAARFTLPADGQRLEAEPSHRTFYEGDDYYFGTAFYLDPAFPIGTTGWQMIEQLKGAPSQGSPPVGFEVADNGLIMSGGYNKPGAATPNQFSYYRRLADLQVGRWYSLVYHVTFSTKPENSFVDVWLDGQKVAENVQPPGATVYPGTPSDDRVGTYRKQGLYHSPTIPGGTIYMTGQKLGTGYAAADPTR